MRTTTLALGAALITTAARADVATTKPPLATKSVAVQAQQADIVAAKNKLQAFQVVASANNTVGTKVLTGHGPYANGVKDPHFVATRVFGTSFAPFHVVYVTEGGRAEWGLRTTDGTTSVKDGDTFNVIGNSAAYPGTPIHGITFASAQRPSGSVTAAAPGVSQIDRVEINGKPNALVFATPRGDGYSDSRLGFTKPYGVWWDNSTRHWTLVTEDKLAWPNTYLEFNLAVFEKPTATGDVRAFRFTVDSKSPDGPTRIPKTMATKNDVVVIQHVVTATSPYLNEPVAVGLEPDTGLWSITTPSKKIPDGTVFNLLVAKKTK